MKPVLAFVAVLALSGPALAESRSVLVVVTHDKDGKAKTAVYSDDKQDRREATVVEEAAKSVAGMKGWGSAVSVYVVTDRRMSRNDRKALFDALDGNAWLDLAYYGDQAPKNLAEYFLKPPAHKAGVEQGKPGLTIDRTDPPQRDGKAHHVVFAGSGAGPVHRAGPEHFKLVRVSDGERVALKVAYDRADLEPEARGEKRVPLKKPDLMEYSYNYQFRGVAFSLSSGDYDAKDAQKALGQLPLYGRAGLEAGEKYRLTWACWPVGASEAVEVSCEFEVGK
jgi:hypothetical protein